MSSPTSLSQNGRDPTRPPLPSSGDGVNSSLESPLPDISDIQPRFAKFLENTSKSKYIMNNSNVSVMYAILTLQYIRLDFIGIIA